MIDLTLFMFTLIGADDFQGTPSMSAAPSANLATLPLNDEQQAYLDERFGNDGLYKVDSFTAR